MTSFLDAPSWLIPTSYQAFMALTSNGAADFCLQECFPTQGPALLDQAGQEMLMRCLPDYQDDQQVLILEVGPGKVYPRGLQLKRHVEVCEVRAVIPVSAQAQTRLQPGLADITLAPPLFEAAFQKEDERRQMEAARMGGKAFLDLLGSATDSAEVRQRMHDIEEALAPPGDDHPRTFLHRLLQFARSGPVSKSDVDLIRDVGSVVNLPSNPTLDSLARRLLEHKGVGMLELLPLFQDLRGSLTELTDTWYPSSLIFLKIKNEIQHSGGRYQGLSSWARELQQAEPVAFTEAALLAGYHFKFKTFGERYWARRVSPGPAQLAVILKGQVAALALAQTQASQPELDQPTPANRQIIKQWLTYAARLRRQGRLDEAIQALQRVLEEDPQNLEVRNALIQVALQKGDYATVIYQHMDCAELHVLAGDEKSALERYETILSMEETVITQRAAPTQREVVGAVKAEVYLRIGEFRLVEGKIEEAHQLLSKSQQLRPGIWDTHMALGRCYIMKQMYQEAMAEFRQVLRLAEADDQLAQDQAHEMLSLVLRCQGDSPSAADTGL